MIGVLSHLLRNIFRFRYHPQNLKGNYKMPAKSDKLYLYPADLYGLKKSTLYKVGPYQL